MATTIRPHTDANPACHPADVGAALRSALEAVNAAYNRLPPALQERIDPGRDSLDRELDAAIASGDRRRALAAIRAWRGHWLAQLEGAVE